MANRTLPGPSMRRRRGRHAPLPGKGAGLALGGGLACALLAAACGSGSDGAGAPDGATDIFGDGGIFVGTTGDGAHGGDAGGVTDALAEPDNLVQADLGGYALGPPITGNTSQPGVVQSGGNSSCALVVGVVRDFRGSNEPRRRHADFETFSGNEQTPGLVAERPRRRSQARLRRRSARTAARPIRRACPTASR